jgi:hypothetical protein
MGEGYWLVVCFEALKLVDSSGESSQRINSGNRNATTRSSFEVQSAAKALYDERICYEGACSGTAKETLSVATAADELLTFNVYV